MLSHAPPWFEVLSRRVAGIITFQRARTDVFQRNTAHVVVWCLLSTDRAPPFVGFCHASAA